MNKMMLTGAAALTVAAAVTACSSPHAAQPQPQGTAAAATAPAVAPSPDICTIYAQQHDAQIAVSPGDQAECNELIKDPRFVLIGRGIYALKEWGYKKGTVADVIAEVLRKEGGPLHRDEIVRRVLKSRQVKETTILLNLQGKPQFKRVAKATYALSE